MTNFELAIISNVLMATCIAACAFCVGLRNGNSATAHVLWIAVFVKLVAPPFYTLPLPVPSQWYDGLVASSQDYPQGYANRWQTKLTPADNRFGRRAEFSAGRLKGTDLSSTRLPSRQPLWSAFVSWPLFVCWLVVAFLLLLKGAIRFRRFSRLLYEKGEHSEEGSRYLVQLLATYGRSRGAKVLLVPIDMAPMLFGIGSSTSVVCPQRLWDALSVERRNAFLAHEAAHYLRRDHWVRWLEWIVSSLYWWLPLTYFARRQLERSEELSCDQWVITRLSTKRRDYAETLFQVAEYLGDHQVASPRLASRMLSTDLLEKRVESILRKPASKLRVAWFPYFSLAVVSTSLLAHPFPYRQPDTLEGKSERSPSQVSSMDHSPGSNLEMPIRESRSPEHHLPIAPTGWWNATPGRQWAELFLASTGSRLIATAGEGLRLHFADGRILKFPNEQLSACVEIPETERMVIADTTGALRLWDLGDGTVISLIGNHATDITSVAFHETTGLVAADAQGSVIRWDHRSGAPLQTWTTQAGPVQSVRWSQAGDRLAVLLGNWSQASLARQLVMLDENHFEELGRSALPLETAIVWEDAKLGWLYADWRGFVHTLAGDLVSRISKQSVSGFVLSQDAIVPTIDSSSVFVESSK